MDVFIEKPYLLDVFFLLQQNSQQVLPEKAASSSYHVSQLRVLMRHVISPVSPLLVLTKVFVRRCQLVHSTNVTEKKDKSSLKTIYV